MEDYDIKLFARGRKYNEDTYRLKMNNYNEITGLDITDDSLSDLVT